MMPVPDIVDVCDTSGEWRIELRFGHGTLAREATYMTKDMLDKLFAEIEAAMNVQLATERAKRG